MKRTIDFKYLVKYDLAGVSWGHEPRRSGTNKAYISKVENDIKDVRISTLQRIIEVGLGGHLNLSVTL